MGKFAFLTGGGGSVGRGLSVEFARAGFDIAIVGRTESKLLDTARAVTAAYPERRVECMVVDVRDSKRLTEAIDASVVLLGQLAVFVHCAAVHHWRAINNATNDEIDEELDVNLRAALHASRAVAPHMIKHNEGAIIFLTSWLMQQLGWPGTSAYLSSKFGLHGLARVVFEDLRNHNIKCSAICPGFIESQGMGRDFAQQFGDYVCLPPNEMLSPTDVAHACLYVINSSTTACPAEIHLQPQKQAVSELGLFVFRDTVPVRRQVQLDKRVVFLTGASRGVGRDAAIRLAKRGYDLALVARSETELQATADLCTPFGVRVKTYALDVANFDALEAAVHDCVESLGNITVLINNAGVNRRRSSLISSRDVWTQTMDINLGACMHATRVALPYMQQNSSGAAVLYISSIVVVQPGVGGSTTYYASKWGLLGFAACVFEDVRHLGIKVSCICPGLINNDMGTRSGPTSFLPPKDLIQNEDVTDSIEFVLNASARACPSRIILFPQKQVISSMRKMREDCDAADTTRARL